MGLFNNLTGGLGNGVSNLLNGVFTPVGDLLGGLTGSGFFDSAGVTAFGAGAGGAVGGAGGGIPELPIPNTPTGNTKEGSPGDEQSFFEKNKKPILIFTGVIVVGFVLYKMKNQ